MKDYSQAGEQHAILKAFCPNIGDTIEPGRFLDIGAWDPITFSNTRALFELGWSGVMIEPAPGPMIEILRCCTKCATGVDARDPSARMWGNRKKRECSECGSIRYGFEPRVTLIQAAMSVVPGFVRIAATDDALSTSDEASEAKWAKDGGFYGYILVPAITWEQVSTQFGGFDFVNIDAEGCSAELFLRMLALGIFPRCCCVEHDGRTTELLNEATKHNYKATLVNGTNFVVVR